MTQMIRGTFWATFILLNFSTITIALSQNQPCEEALRKVAYYAHPLSIYGTPQEERDIKIIESLGFKVLNPNAPEHDAGYKLEGMNYFVRLIHEKADLLIFRAFADGRIPAGIAKEIEAMKAKGGAVIELPTALTRRTLSVQETREFLQEDGAR